MANEPICSFRRSFSDNDQSTCQFRLNDSDLIRNSNGQYYCPFHLTDTDIDTDQQQKYYWGQNKTDKFTNLFKEHVERSLKYDEVADFTGTHFPAKFKIDDVINTIQAVPILIFDRTKWLCAIRLRRIEFAHEISFVGAEFVKPITFLECHFKQNVEFSRSVFDFGSVFTDCQFEDYLFIDNSKLKNIHRFVRSSFLKEVDLGDSEIDTLRIAESTFSGKFRLKGSTISGAIDAEHSIFKDKADFRIVSQNPIMKFRDSRFYDDADFSFLTQSGVWGEDNVLGSADFTSATFFKRACFVNRSFEEPTSFKNAIFHVAPEFFGSKLHQDTNFEDSLPTGFLDLGGADERVSAVRAYRTLKHAMEEVRDRLQQLEFFKLEQKALRLSGQLPASVAIASTVYELTSDYGQSFVRPSVSILVTVVGFFGLYSCLYFADLIAYQSSLVTELISGYPPMEFTPSPFKEFGDAFRFAMEQTFRPFSAFAAQPTVPIYVAIIGAFQSIAVLGLLALVLLGLRNRFRLN